MITASRKSFLFVGTILFLLMSPVQFAFAHTALILSTPSADSQVTDFPDKITLEFSEGLLELAGKETSSIEVVAPSGEKVDDGHSKVQGSKLSVGLVNSSEDGIFNVQWRAVADDGHPVEGNFNFSVAPKISSTTPTPEISTTAQQPANHSNSVPIIELFGVALVLIAGLALLIIRWRRKAGD